MLRVTNEGTISNNTNDPPTDTYTFDQITLKEHYEFSNGTKVASGTVDFTGVPTDNTSFWRIDVTSAPADFSLRAIMFGRGTKTKSYLNVEETRIQPLHLATYTEKLNLLAFSSNVMFDRNNANIHKITVIGNTTFTFTGFVADRCASMTLFVTNGGSYNVTWNGSIEWINGSGEIMLKSNGTDIITLTSLDGGTTIYATYVQ